MFICSLLFKITSTIPSQNLNTLLKSVKLQASQRENKQAGMKQLAEKTTLAAALAGRT